MALNANNPIVPHPALVIVHAPETFVRRISPKRYIAAAQAPLF